MTMDADIPSNLSVPVPGDAIDWSVLDALQILQKPGAPDLRLRLMTMYLNSSAKLMEGIRTALDNSDVQLLTTSAHTLKSTSLSLGAMKLGAICAKLEIIGRNNTLEEVGDLRMQAEEQYGAVISIFKEVLRQSEV